MSKRALSATFFVVAMLLLDSVVFSQDLAIKGKVCRTDKGLPGTMEMSNCIADPPEKQAAPPPIKCVYGQAGCVLGRRDVEKTLKERGDK